MINDPDSHVVEIIIAEDYELSRIGLKHALEREGQLKVIAEAENGAALLSQLSTLQPDAILMDIAMPGLDGIQATQQIKRLYPNIRILMLTSHAEGETVKAALAAGADAYCLKDISASRLRQVFDIVLEGGIFLDPAIARTVMNTLPLTHGDPGKFPGGEDVTRRRYNTELTEREREVLALIAQGKSNRDIADDLMITTHTVKAHVCSIIQKLHVQDRTQAAIKALQQGIVALDVKHPVLKSGKSSHVL